MKLRIEHQSLEQILPQEEFAPGKPIFASLGATRSGEA